VICDSQQRPLEGVATQEMFTVFPCRVKIQGLAFIGCAWQWPCRRHCFASENYLQGENLGSLIGRRQRLSTVSFFEASFLEGLDSSVVLVVSMSLLLRI
jgi:hypothetical protein